MDTEAQLKNLSTEAGQLLAEINNEHVDLKKLKSFLSRLALTNNPTSQQLKKIADRARVEKSIK